MNETSLAADVFSRPRLEVGLLKFVAAHLVLKAIHFAGIPLTTQCRVSFEGL